mmetsp:Transcript_50019/g.150483  ORF Transcript_50019/g.150483 Transcript_50019/m.150483 type:complete len:112 (+) Transcript_50019:567-902(+)
MIVTERGGETGRPLIGIVAVDALVEVTTKITEIVVVMIVITRVAGTVAKAGSTTNMVMAEDAEAMIIMRAAAVTATIVMTIATIEIVAGVLIVKTAAAGRGGRMITFSRKF